MAIIPWIQFRGNLISNEFLFSFFMLCFLSYLNWELKTKLELSCDWILPWLFSYKICSINKWPHSQDNAHIYCHSDGIFRCYCCILVYPRNIRLLLLLSSSTEVISTLKGSFSLSLSNSLRWFLNKRRTWESNGVCVFCFSRVPNQLNDSLRKKDIRLIWLFQQQKGFTATIIFITLCYSCVRVCFSCYFVTSIFFYFYYFFFSSLSLFVYHFIPFIPSPECHFIHAFTLKRRLRETNT